MAATKPPPISTLDIDDEELLDRARRARSGAKFRRLYDRGDTSDYPSASEADFAIINMLTFWCAGDEERIIRLFEASSLYRKPPEKDVGYVERSVREALATYQGSYYRPRSVRRARKEEAEDPLTPYLSLLLDPAIWRGKRGASAYKAYAAAVILADKHGITDDDGNLRIGIDMRRLAETAGMERKTLGQSALPYLVSEMELVRWRRGKGREAGNLVLPTPALTDSPKCVDTLLESLTATKNTH